MRRAVAVLVSLAAVLTTGCGGSDEASSETSATVTWAGDLCSAATTWTDEVQRIADEVTDVSSLSEDSLRESASELGDATQTFIDDVRSLGRPDSEAGDQAQQVVESLADSVDAEKQQVEDAVDGASGLSGIASAVSTVASSVATMVDDVQGAVDELRAIDASGELESAFEQAPACDRYTSS